MIEFVTLFLGLTFGAQTVELVATGDRVARIELLLDGAAAATLVGEPWRGEVELGPLAPHQLEAVAYDAGGRELGRALQWINTPKPPAEVRLVLEPAEKTGLPQHARLTWESLSGQAPTRVDVRFDGKPIEVADPARFRLPAADAGEAHFLTADVRFADQTWAHTEASFGGRFGDEVLTELSAWPLRWSSKARRTELARCFRAGGSAVRLATIEKGAAEVLIVREAAAEALLTGLGPKEGDDEPLPALGTGRGLNRVSGKLADPENHRFEMLLGDDDELRFLWPTTSATAHPTYRQLTRIDSSQPLRARDGGLFWFLTRAGPPRPGGDQLLADAVAVAGVLAAASDRRRAVVLVLGEPSPADKSQTPAADVRAYLDKLRVPLHVWSTSGPAATAWGEPRPITTMRQLDRAVRALKNDLASQRIAWLDGPHTAAVTLDPANCAGVELLD